MTTSTPGIFNSGCKSTGIPLPLSVTVREPSWWIITFIKLQKPARASSIELSRTSITKWWRPLRPTSPMYIEGLFITASKSFKTVILSAL